MPRPKALLKYAERWKPYRSAGAWYMWRAVDLHQQGKLPKRAGRAPRIECEAPREKPAAKGKAPLQAALKKRASATKKSLPARKKAKRAPAGKRPARKR